MMVSVQHVNYVCQSCHISQLTPTFQKTTENFSFPELISLALALF